MKHASPRSEFVIQTLAMPQDTNVDGDIFGGWILSHMDIAAGIVAKRVALGKKVVTVAIDSMTFVRPVKVGDVVSCYVELLKVGTTSITMSVEAWVKTFDNDVIARRATPDPVFASASEAIHAYLVTKGKFIFVAVDDAGKPVAVKA